MCNMHVYYYIYKLYAPLTNFIHLITLNYQCKQIVFKFGLVFIISVFKQIKGIFS